MRRNPSTTTASALAGSRKTAPGWGRSEGATPAVAPRRDGKHYLYLRQMRDDDAPRVQALRGECGCVETRAGGPGIDIVAEDTGRLVGAACCDKNGRTGFIRNLATVPGASQARVETELIRRCLCFLRTLGITRCYVQTARGRRFIQLADVPTVSDPADEPVSRDMPLHASR
jgi:hypothetical protein